MGPSSSNFFYDGQKRSFETSVTNDTLGRAGEFLVCADFALLGFDVALCPFAASASDVLVDLGDRVLRIQVKTTRSPKGTRRDGRRYRFTLNKGGKKRYGRIDVFAFVAADIGATRYVVASDLAGGQYGHKTFGAASFAARAHGSLEACLKSLLSPTAN